jgi:hypothetical protein
MFSFVGVLTPEESDACFAANFLPHPPAQPSDPAAHDEERDLGHSRQRGENHHDACGEKNRLRVA